jgi:hypothetical protein
VKGEDFKIKRPEQFLRERRIVSALSLFYSMHSYRTYVQKAGSQNKMKRKEKLMERRTSKSVAKMLNGSTVALVIRIHAGKHSSDEIKKTLKHMHLKNKYDAVFVRLDEAKLSKVFIV